MIRTEAVFFLQDWFDQLAGRRDPLIPPRRLMFDGPSDPQVFRANGAQFLKYYQDKAYRQAGFEIVRHAPGQWSGRPDFLDFQDLIRARRSADTLSS